MVCRDEGQRSFNPVARIQEANINRARGTLIEGIKRVSAAVALIIRLLINIIWVKYSTNDYTYHEHHLFR